MSEPKVKTIDLEYPRNPDAEFDTIEVGLLDVRAADNIRIRYDFERDGWSIQQARSWMQDMGERSGYPYAEQRDDWREVAFCKAWALECPEHGLECNGGCVP